MKAEADLFGSSILFHFFDVFKCSVCFSQFKPGDVDVVDENDSIVVFVDHDNIYVKSSKAGTLDIYDILSRLIVKNAQYDEGVTLVATLPKGIYIVNGKKVIVR